MAEKLKSVFGKIPARYWIYLTVGTAMMLAVSLALGLTGVETPWYSVFWGLFATAAAVLVARTIYHIATGDNTAEMWAISIYGIVADLGWLVGILTNSYSVATIGIVILAAGAMMALGTRFIGKGGIKVQKAEILSGLSKTLRYRFMGDAIDGKLDIDRPLIVTDMTGDKLTIAEAREAGLEKEADEAEKYIMSAIDSYVSRENRK